MEPTFRKIASEVRLTNARSPDCRLWHVQPAGANETTEVEEQTGVYTMQMLEMQNRIKNTATAGRQTDKRGSRCFPTARGSESKTDAVARVASAGFTRSGDFDDLTPSKAVVSGDRIRELYTRQLCFLQSAAER